MADIKQAAKWIMEGHDVWRISDDKQRWITPYYPGKTTFAVVDSNGDRESLTCDDILADDWEIVEEKP